MEPRPIVLQARELHTFYGQSHVLHGVSVEVRAGEVVALMGRNGAGKTTTLRSIMGLTPPRRGQVFYKGADITGRPPYVLNGMGIGFVPEDRGIFPDLTVAENLRAGLRSDRTGRWDLAAVEELFPVLANRRHQKGKTLSGGEQQMLSIARCLLGNPEFLMLDEPLEGLAPKIAEQISEVIHTLRRTGLTVLVVEQGMRWVQQVADRCYILNRGTVVYEGTMQELAAAPQIQELYLGVRRQAS